MPAEPFGRVFVAVDLSDDLRHGLAAHLTDHLGGRALPGRPVVPRNWHLTLRFLGKVDEPGKDRLAHALDRADLGAPFDLGFAGLGAFPRPRRATVLWLATGRGSEELTRLAAGVEAAVSDAGYLPEERPFHPHVTLSRIRPHQDVTVTVDAVPPYPGVMPVTQVIVFRSHLRGGPPTYEPVERIELGR